MSQNAFDLVEYNTTFSGKNCLGEDFSFEFDINDAESAVLYHSSALAMQNKHLAAKKDIDVIEDIRYFCQVCREFFDDIFEAGAGVTLLPKDNRRYAVQVYASFMSFISAQHTSIQTTITNISALVTSQTKA